MQKLRTVKEIAPLLQITEDRLWALCRSGFFPAGIVVRFQSRQIRINEQKLSEWIESGGAVDEATRGAEIKEEKQ